MPSYAGDFNRPGDANRSTTRLLISVIRKLSEHSGDASLREEERRKLEDSYGVVDDRLKKIVKAFVYISLRSLFSYVRLYSAS